MGRRKKEHPGRPAEHKGSWRVWWNGRYHDLGPANSPEAKAEYARLCALWASDPGAVPLARGELLVTTLCRDYLASDSAPPPGKTREVHGRAIQLLLEHHLTTPVAAFGPVALSSWQSWLCSRRDAVGRQVYSRSTVVRFVGIVRAIWKWGVATERVQQDRHTALLSVEGPRPGKARTPKVVPPADPADAAKVLEFLRPPARAAVELLALTGAGRVELDGDVWVAVPESHKTAHHGKFRWLVLGKRAQAVLAPLLDRDPEAYCIDPREATADLRAAQRAARTARGGGSGGSRKKATGGTKQVPTRRYTSGTLRNAVLRACERAGVGRFTPYQLRHAALSEIDLRYGLDAAQHVGGHSSPQTTRRYAKRSFLAAARVARELG